jgi:hypothetical protein
VVVIVVGFFYSDSSHYKNQFVMITYKDEKEATLKSNTCVIGQQIYTETSDNMSVLLAYR